MGVLATSRSGAENCFKIDYICWEIKQRNYVELKDLCYLGLIPSGVKPMTLRFIFTASLLDAQHQADSVENKPASLLVVSSEKTLSGIMLE